MTNLQLILNINPKVVLYNDKYYLALNSFFGLTSKPNYTLFLLINEKIFNDSNSIIDLLYSFDNKSVDEISEIIAHGVSDYVYGEDYAISWSLYRYLLEYNDNLTMLPSESIDSIYIFPDLLDESFNLINTDKFTTVADTDLRYYYLLNQLQNSTFSADELNSFVKTFCRIILDNTSLTDFSDVNNLIYKNVLNYYANGGTDDALVMLNLILNNSSLIPGQSVSCCDSYSTSDSSSIAGINNLSILDNITTSSVSCKDIYMSAMFAYLKQMLSDIHFYCDWFMIETSTNTTHPNLLLITKLKQLFDEFLALNYNLSFNKSNAAHDCKCNNKNTYVTSENTNNYNILNNYYKVLTYAETDTLEPNCNKIKVYGSEFATLLPNLLFV